MNFLKWKFIGTIKLLSIFTDLRFWLRLVSARLVEAENFDGEASVKIFSLDESR